MQIAEFNFLRFYSKTSETPNSEIRILKCLENMRFWDLKILKLDEFRPGIWSKLESGKNLTMAFMQIAPNKEGAAHDHPFDQCGIVIEGEIEISIGEEKKLLKPMETYFIPAGIKHNWKTFSHPAKILDIVAKQD